MQDAAQGASLPGELRERHWRAFGGAVPLSGEGEAHSASAARKRAAELGGRADRLRVLPGHPPVPDPASPGSGRCRRVINAAGEDLDKERLSLKEKTKEKKSVLSAASSHTGRVSATCI